MERFAPNPSSTTGTTYLLQEGAALGEDGAALKGIQEVAGFLGITARTLRFYEDKGLIEPCRIGTMRVYRQREIARMQLILRGKRIGLSLREIERFLDLYDTEPRHREQLQGLAVRCRERIEQFEQRRIALDQTIAELTWIEGQALERAIAQDAPG